MRALWSDWYLDNDLLAQYENSLSHAVVHKNLSKHASEGLFLRFDHVYFLSLGLRSIKWCEFMKELNLELTEWLKNLPFLSDLYLI
jgi:hypothetical protein